MENIEPRTSLCPTTESIVDSLPPAKAWFQITPRSTSANHPNDCFHERSVLSERGLLRCGQRPRTTVNDVLAANRAYRQHIDVRQPVELAHWWELRAALQETEHLYNVWDKVRDARCEYYYVHVRRDALKQLRQMVGEEAYATGQLPPGVPPWRLQRVR